MDRNFTRHLGAWRAGRGLFCALVISSSIGACSGGGGGGGGSDGSGGSGSCSQHDGSWTISGDCGARQCVLDQTGCALDLACDDGTTYVGAFSGSSITFGDGDTICDGTASSTSASGKCAGEDETCTWTAKKGSSSSCSVPGQACSAASDCCQSGSTVGSHGALCIGTTDMCHSACTSGSQCNSGCCATVDGSSLGACADASYCQPSQCQEIGESCSNESDCCQTSANGNACIGDPIFQCSAKCTASDQCASNCCVQLKGVSYGACIANSSYPCM